VESSQTRSTGAEPGRAERLIETMPVGFIFWDREWRCAGVNAEGERLCGLSAEQLDGRAL
jgi:PAS domain-containing protein